MSLQKIRFSELDFKYDTDRLLKELNILKFVQYLTDASTHINHCKMPIFNQSQIKNCKIWKGINLTNPSNSVFVKNSSLSRIRNENSELEWVWIKEFPYMQYIVKSLGFLKINLIRVLVLEPGSIGPVHNDNSTGSYYSVNRTSITLNISDGGSPLVFLNGNEIHSKMPGSTFLFRDDCWHGIPETKTQRFQVRINGIVNETVNKLLLQNTIMEII